LDSTCGFICKPKDYKALGQSVVTLLQDDVLRKRMGEIARKKVIDNFTIDKFIREYEMAYEYIISKKAQDLIYLNSHLQQEAMEAS
jgi:glycosyltransferase involved in cell wall biosynthesis